MIMMTYLDHGRVLELATWQCRSWSCAEGGILVLPWIELLARHQHCTWAYFVFGQDLHCWTGWPHLSPSYSLWISSLKLVTAASTSPEVSSAWHPSHSHSVSISRGSLPSEGGIRLIVFGSDRSSRCHNVCPSVRPAQYAQDQSRAVNLHLSRSESNQEH